MAERRRVFGILIAALVVLAGLLAGVAWIPLAQARAKWRAGKTAEAIRDAHEWSRLKLWRSQYQQFLAAAYLSAGRPADAQKHLDALRRAWLWIPAVSKEEVARRLFARGAYEEFLAYDKASRERYESDDVALYRAAALLGANRIAEADAALRAVDAGDVDAQKRDALARAIAERKGGRWAFVVDRRGAPIATYVLDGDDVVASSSEFEALVEKEGGRLTVESNARRLGVHDTIELTLDARVQKAALKALGGYRGSLVAIDPATGEILALATSDARNLALEKQYEPGSVMKVLTLASGAMVPFPYTCDGALEIDGRSFGDWREEGHGVLRDINDAMAQSCNVVFADLGLRAGRDKLMALHRRAGFDGQTDLGLFQVPLGRTVGRLFNNFETAFYAIGLEHETTTTLHLAMLASMIANRGTLTSPRLVRARRSILGEVTPPPQQRRVEVVSREAAGRVIAAMEAVVTHPLGTGRRAKVEGVRLALKTGTAGKREQGFDALVVGFAPVDRPRIAFAVIAENAGPAELAAAKIAHHFVTEALPSP